MTHRVIVITRDTKRFSRRPYTAATAGFPINYRRARFSTARSDAEAIAQWWQAQGDTTEIRDFTQVPVS